MKLPFSWKAGSARMRSRTSSSLAVMPSRFGLGKRRLFLDHLLDDPLVDAELPEQLSSMLPPYADAVGLHLLLVGAPETVDRDVAAVHGATTSLGAAPASRVSAGNLGM